MIDHVWTVFCTDAVIDRDSNNVSIYNAIEQITIRGEPQPKGVLNIPFTIISLWVRSDFDVPGQAQARLTLYSPSRKKKLLEKEYDIDLIESERLRTRWYLQGLPIAEPGRHTFQLQLRIKGEDKWRKVASIPLKIVFISSEEPEEAKTR